MKKPNTSERAGAAGRDKERRSPYVPVKIAAGALAGFSLCDVVLDTFTDYYFFPKASFCQPVFAGESFDLILNDLPCRITQGSVVDFIVAFGIACIVLQIPALVLWAVIAYRERRRKSSSRYFPVFVLAVATFALSFSLDVWDFWGPFEKNTQGEYCDYVTPGEPYHLILNDVPCRITSQFFLEFGFFLVAANILLQIPTLILWAGIAMRERRKRRRGAAAAGTEPADRFGVMIHRLQDEESGPETREGPQ